MNEEKSVRAAAAHSLKIILQRVIGFALFCAAAGTVSDVRANVFFAMYFLAAVVSVAILFKRRPQTLSEREQKRENTEWWDKILMPVLVLLMFFGIYIAAGLGVRFGCARLDGEWMYAGYALFAFSFVFSLWSVMENRFLESTVRIQSDRGHTVVSTGPYRIVRHPGYLGTIAGTAAAALILGSLPAAGVAAAVIVLFFVRTYFEDAMLKRELDGYLAYSRDVKYRLLPFIW